MHRGVYRAAGRPNAARADAEVCSCRRWPVCAGGLSADPPTICPHRPVNTLHSTPPCVPFHPRAPRPRPAGLPPRPAMGGTRAAAAAAAWACALVCAVAQPAPAPSPAVFLTEQAALQAATEALSALSPPTLNCAVVGAKCRTHARPRRAERAAAPLGASATAELQQGGAWGVSRRREPRIVSSGRARGYPRHRCSSGPRLVAQQPG